MHAEQPYYFFSSLASTVGNAFKSAPKNPKRIMVVKNDEIGDMVYALHVLKALRTKYADAEITLLCTRINASWVSELGLVDVIIHDLSAREKHYDLWLELRGWYSSLLASLGPVADWQSLRWPEHPQSHQLCATN